MFHITVKIKNTHTHKVCQITQKKKLMPLDHLVILLMW